MCYKRGHKNSKNAETYNKICTFNKLYDIIGGEGVDYSETF